MSAKALMVIGVICLAEALLGSSRSLARGSGGFHGGSISAGRGGQMGGFSMHGSAMGHYPRRAGKRADEREEDGHRMFGETNWGTGTITVTRTRTTTSGTATTVSATGRMTDHIRKGLGVEVPASAKGPRRTTSGRDLESRFRLRRQLPRPDNRQWSVARWKLIALGRGGPMK